MPYKNKEDRLASYKKRYQMKKEEVAIAGKKRREEKFEEISEKKREWHLKTTFGITVDDYNNMFLEQDGCCAICKKHQSCFKKRLAVDHDHKTGKIRGLLCSSCNQAIGLLQDNIEFLNSAIKYLQD